MGTEVKEEAEREGEGTGMGAERGWIEKEVAAEVPKDAGPTLTKTKDQEEVRETVLLPI